MFQIRKQQPPPHLNGNNNINNNGVNRTSFGITRSSMLLNSRQSFIETPSSSQQHRQQSYKRRSTLLSTPASNIKRRQSSNFQNDIQTSQSQRSFSIPNRPSQTPIRTSNDLRPIKDKKYQELIQKEIYSFLIENKFETKTNITINENTLKSPTQKHFNEIFKFLYLQLDPYYIFQKPIEQEMILILKSLQYPYLNSISRSHFSAVGGSNWPTFSSILFWLVKLNLEILNLQEADFITNDEFDKIHIKYTKDSYVLFINGEEDTDPYYDDMKNEMNNLKEKLDLELVELTEQRDKLAEKIELLNQELYNRNLIDEKSIALEDDYIKLKAFNDNVEKRIPDWNIKLQQLSNELILLEEKYNEINNEKNNLTNELSLRNKSIDEINNLFITRDKLSKDIELVTDKVEKLNVQYEKRVNEFETNFQKLNQLCGNYNQSVKMLNYGNDYNFSIELNNLTKNEGLEKHQILNKNLKEEFYQLQQIELNTNKQVMQEKEITRKQTEEYESLVEKIKEQTFYLDELKLQDEELKKNIEEIQQQMYREQDKYTKEINKLDHQSREMKNSISGDILELEGKLRDTYITRSKIQEEISIKRQEMEEQQMKITSFVINFRRSIQEKLIKLDDFIQIELQKFE
ncbi:unnamed protein product [Candida verbasci]|uniref:Kinetochore protein NDC80 n=1 Tax=Candida verbasci TaxID=1227364 RepID=A0A9W4TPZ4_9ASCO|nr:unnamed protein product [Candida verbasci]